MMRRLSPLAGAAWLAALVLLLAPQSRGAQPPPKAHPETRFQSSSGCLACHNGLTTPSGEDVSIGSAWRASMMANSSRDPYWQASVRREVIDHPSAAKDIEDECSICHMPMSATLARASGRRGEIFPHLPIGRGETDENRLAADGVSCTLCHQIGPDRLGTAASFTGGFVVNPVPPAGEPTMFGPFAVDAGRTALMRSATGVVPAESSHVRQSELCATCHTLYTQALGPGGAPLGRLPEQMPYLEWRHSAFREERSCQSCHMPAVEDETPIASVLGDPRPGLGRHGFLGGNFFMLRMLNRYRHELGVEALPAELDAAAHATLRQLQTETATVSIVAAATAAGRLTADVAVSNLTGHKLPTGYPSRRVWVHFTVRDREGRTVFESGAVAPSGAILGNDADAAADGYEPHYDEIQDAAQVQIYESVMADAAGSVTTGLLKAIGYAKDNRLLPRGFDKATAAGDIAVHGTALTDGSFLSGGDRVRFNVSLAGAAAPFRVDVELRYQPIAFRWAENLRGYDPMETRRFVTFYESMAAASSTVLARDAVAVD